MKTIKFQEEIKKMRDWIKKGKRLYSRNIKDMGIVKVYDLGNGYWQVFVPWHDEDEGLPRFDTLSEAMDCANNEILKLDYK